MSASLSAHHQPLWLQVVSALDFMHQHPTRSSNRDVKASNVLITTFEEGADGISRPSVKVADFGFADRDRRKTRLGTMGCMAPEIFFLPCAPIKTQDKVVTIVCEVRTLQSIRIFAWASSMSGSMVMMRGSGSDVVHARACSCAAWWRS